MQILKDIYKLAGEEYGMIPNIFAIHVKESLILIDCGTDANDWKIAEENMKYWELDHLPITHVLITHAHGDHAGYASELQERGAKIIAGYKATSVEREKDPLNFYYAYPQPFKPFKPDYYVKDREKFNIHGLELMAVTVPGHSIGDTIYCLNMYGKKIMFLGDIFHIDEYGSGAWIGNQWFLDSDYDQYMRSLFKIKDMDADVLLSGHKHGAFRNAKFILKDAFIKAQEKFDGRWDKKNFIGELKKQGVI